MTGLTSSYELIPTQSGVRGRGKQGTKVAGRQVRKLMPGSGHEMMVACRRAEIHKLDSLDILM